MTETSVKKETLKAYLFTYFKSLNKFPDKYLSLFFVDPINPPEHFAYLCPLCLKNGIIVERTIGIGMHDEFSLDHFPPESVGGFQTMLVCKKCNNEAGKLYDFSLKEKIQNMAFHNKVPSASLKSKSKITDVTGNYPSKLTIDEKGEMEISLKPFEKIHAPYLDEFIEYSKTNSDYKIDLTFKIPDESKVFKALLKTAYLACFELWGYDFIFSETGEIIKSVLNGEAEYPVKNIFFWVGDSIKENKIEHFPLGVCYLKDPAEFKSFTVNIRVVDTETGYGNMAVILIPGPNKEDWENLNHIEATITNNPTTNVSVAHVTENILNNNIINGYQKSWELLNS